MPSRIIQQINSIRSETWRDAPIFLQTFVSVFAVLAIADQIPVKIVEDPSKADFLSKGTEGGITVGDTMKVLPFELTSDIKLAFSVILFIFLTSAFVTAVAKWVRSRRDFYVLSYATPPAMFMICLYISVGFWPSIYYCGEKMGCVNTWLYIPGPTAKLLPVFAILQSLLIGLVAWIYTHERLPNAVAQDRELIKHHLNSWWNRVKAIDRFLLAAVVGLSLPFVLNRTGLGIWTILILIGSFGTTVIMILNFMFKKADAAQQAILRIESLPYFMN
jgi:hypothetical protein